MSEALFTGVHHVGFTVPKLEEALEFFIGVLSFELVSRHGPLVTNTEINVE